MLFQITVPASNERGPRYLEKALAAVHQGRLRRAVSLMYGVRDGQIGLFVRCDVVDREAVIEPMVAGYPEATVALVEDQRAGDVSPPCQLERSCQLDCDNSTRSLDADRQVWSTDVELVPELFPILRHAQFEDLLNHNFADPVSGLLRAILPEVGIECRIEITIRPASRHRVHQARRAVMLLEREFFRRHHRLASYFANRITRPGRWYLAWLFGLIARCSPHPNRTSLETSTSRSHEREEDLQAAADKLGGHLFETRIRLIVAVNVAEVLRLQPSPPEPNSHEFGYLKSHAVDRLRRSRGCRPNTPPLLAAFRTRLSLRMPRDGAKSLPPFVFVCACFVFPTIAAISIRHQQDFH